ncbi:hypothetical protein [Ascidiaceihabitans donghaensis]|nr:hypothetical protein [Ascidiaceihabitans donghaensis]
MGHSVKSIMTLSKEPADLRAQFVSKRLLEEFEALLPNVAKDKDNSNGQGYRDDGHMALFAQLAVLRSIFRHELKGHYRIEAPISKEKIALRCPHFLFVATSEKITFEYRRESGKAGLRSRTTHMDYMDRPANLGQPAIEKDLAQWDGESFSMFSVPLHGVRSNPYNIPFFSTREWGFWTKWYQGYLDGLPLDWKLQLEVAKIRDGIWEAGPEAVAYEIERIQAEMFFANSPQVEEVYKNSDGLYDVRASILDPSTLVQSVLDRVSFALSLALDSNHCDLNSMSVAAKMLRHALENCPDDPNALEQWLRNANGLISKGIEGANLAESDELDALISTLTETALQLRADHPEVGEAVKTRTAQRLREIAAEKRKSVALRMDAMVDGTGARLRAEYQLDAAITRDGSDVDATAEAMQRSGNRAQKISLAERAKKVEGSGAMSVAKIGMRAKSLVEIIASLFSGIG